LFKSGRDVTFIELHILISVAHNSASDGVSLGAVRT
jgi:hypothetical protein